MRVAFDAMSLTSPAGGVRRYAHELFGALARHDDLDVIAVAPAAAAVVPAGVRVHRIPLLAAPSNLGRAAVVLPATLCTLARDVFHAPAYTAPLWQGQPLILTIHDVVYARRPEWYPARVDPVRQWFYRTSARRAARVVTDSSFSRDEIVAAYGLDPARIDVVPLAAAAHFTPGDGAPRDLTVLHVGDLHVRRNLPMLLDVVVQLRQQSRWASLTLTLVGTDRGVLDGLKAQATHAGHPDALVVTGPISEQALVEHYRRATVFAYPSRYEGFGVPLLEAMQCGLPVVAARAGSIPEVVGSAAVLVDPDDARGWHEAIAALLADGSLASAAAAAGLTRASQFTWDATARATRQVYARVTTTARGI